MTSKAPVALVVLAALSSSFRQGGDQSAIVFQHCPTDSYENQWSSPWVCVHRKLQGKKNPSVSKVWAQENPCYFGKGPWYFS